jgi:hypothetical protein
MSRRGKDYNYKIQKVALKPHWILATIPVPILRDKDIAIL